jgi:DNA-binding CsgD family transcriptional regulator
VHPVSSARMIWPPRTGGGLPARATPSEFGKHGRQVTYMTNRRRSRGAAGQFQPPAAPDQQDAEVVRLSARQVECLARIAAGETSAEIAASLGLSVRTVDHYIGDACRRLGVRTRSHAVAKAIALGKIAAPAI